MFEYYVADHPCERLSIHAGNAPVHVVARAHRNGDLTAWTVPSEQRAIIHIERGSAVLARSDDAQATLVCYTGGRSSIDVLAPMLTPLPHCEYRTRDLLTPTNVSDDLVTLCTHTSLADVGRLAGQLEQWNGPASVAILMRDDDPDAPAPQALAAALKNLSQHPLSARLVVQSGSRDCEYPVAFMARVAAIGVTSQRALHVDVHLWPGVPNMCAAVGRSIAAAERHRSARSTVYVVPALQTKHAPNIPDAKDHVIEYLMNGYLQPLAFDRLVLAHFPTDYYEWIAANTSYVVTYAPRYEPYVVAPTNLINEDTKADEDECDQGLVARALHTKALHDRGMEFEVLPDVFLIRLKEPNARSRGAARLPYPLNEYAVSLAWRSSV